MILLSRATLVLVTALLPVATLSAAGDSQHLVVKQSLQVPGAILQSGAYTMSLEDTLNDRAIVRISSAGDASPTFLLAVPNTHLRVDSASHISYFKSANEKALRAWKCPSCSVALEFVYPKLEAAKLTDETAEPVMAVDPAYDKLPDNLSASDRKVVTLWLLSPERIVADHTGQGVKAAKYVSPGMTGDLLAKDSGSLAGSNEPGSLQSSSSRRRLPATASNSYEMLLGGVLALGLGMLMRAKRVRQC